MNELSEKEKEIRKIFAANLKLYRTLNGWLQKDLAEKLGVKQNMVGHWETTYAFPSLDMLIKIVDTLGAGSIDDFCRKKAKIAYTEAA